MIDLTKILNSDQDGRTYQKLYLMTDAYYDKVDEEYYHLIKAGIAFEPSDRAKNLRMELLHTVCDVWVKDSASYSGVIEEIMHGILEMELGPSWGINAGRGQGWTECFGRFERYQDVVDYAAQLCNDIREIEEEARVVRTDRRNRILELRHRPSYWVGGWNWRDNFVMA